MDRDAVAVPPFRGSCMSSESVNGIVYACGNSEGADKVGSYDQIKMRYCGIERHEDSAAHTCRRIEGCVSVYACERIRVGVGQTVEFIYIANPRDVTQAQAAGP